MTFYIVQSLVLSVISIVCVLICVPPFFGLGVLLTL